MVYTGSTSCDDRATRGSSKGKIMVNLKENAREEKEIKRLNQECIQYGKPPHYDLEKAKDNIVWESCLTYEEAFESVFGEAMEDFNAKQKRSDRKTSIEKELAKLDKGKVKQELIHSMVVQVGNEDHHPSKEKCIEILKKYREEFKKRYPNMRIVSCAIHLDETTPHLQIYYIPVKTKEQHLQSGSAKKWSGMDVQPSLTGALEQMGYTNDATIVVDGKEVKDYKAGAMAQWQKDFNGLLDEICKDYEIKIDHYMRGKKVSHKDTLDYYDGTYKEKITQTKEELITLELAAQDKRETLQNVQKEVLEKQDKVSSLKQEESGLKGQIRSQKDELDELVLNKENFIRDLWNEIKSLWKDLTSQERRQERLERRAGRVFGKANQLKKNAHEELNQVMEQETIDSIYLDEMPGIKSTRDAIGMYKNELDREENLLDELDLE